MDKEFPLTAAEFTATVDTTGTEKNDHQFGGAADLKAAEVTPLLSNQTQMLFAMQRLKKHVFEGVSNYDAVLKRRKANKVARAQRKVNRKKV